ncbi:hypothetical protein ACQJBY_007266 [Aegilops geniculata]
MHSAAAMALLLPLVFLLLAEGRRAFNSARRAMGDTFLPLQSKGRGGKGSGGPRSRSGATPRSAAAPAPARHRPRGPRGRPWMDGGGTLGPHPPMDDDNGGLLSVGWGAKLAVALDTRDGLQHLDFKGRPSQWKWKDDHHGGRAGVGHRHGPVCRPTLYFPEACI